MRLFSLKFVSISNASAISATSASRASAGNKPVVAASLLAADFGCLAQEATAAVQAGCEWLHIDIMDGCYVPQISFGPAVAAVARKAAPDATVDVHLMVDRPERIIPAALDAGADWISFHPDSTNQAWRCMDMIREGGCRAGCVLSPGIGLAYAADLVAAADLVLIMTVEPGYGGQKMIPGMISKVAAARAQLDSCKSAARLEVDGGVAQATIGELAQAGADTFVVGSALFGAKDEYPSVVGQLLEQAND